MGAQLGGLRCCDLCCRARFWCYRYCCVCGLVWFYCFRWFDCFLYRSMYFGIGEVGVETLDTFFWFGFWFLLFACFLSILKLVDW